uniref:Uncharacterized protein n=1 Tax=Macaca fascicularis TaxID=9541 RepID=A0A2K5TXW5_MACFA
PTEKTAEPRHPFFIGSWPEPVSCGGIFSPCFGQPQNCDPGVVTSDKILSKTVGKSKCGCWQRWLGLCAWSEDSAHWSRDLPLRCWLCPCLWGSTLVLAGP